ncbi:flagellar basal body P-ring formation chaperone FlgA [Parasulfuritortus cantonensis]|nr:flagellar basal body P-ring formation chaperone FlgA [Parasulfuritortus cantonensis]
MIIAVDMRCLRVCVTLVLMCQAVAHADDRQDFTALRQAAAGFVARQATAAYPGTRVAVEIGPVDPRLALAACPAPAFAVSPGSSLWGAGSLSASCGAPTAWELYLTYQVRLAGPALLARRPLAPGSTPGPGDLARGTVEYAGDPGRYPRDENNLRGIVLTRPLAKGNPLTIEMVRARQLVKAGQRVRIVVDGNGFQVSLEGIAQGQGGIGDSVRLKTASGRYVQGTVQPDGTVRVAP